MKEAIRRIILLLSVLLCIVGIVNSQNKLALGEPLRELQVARENWGYFYILRSDIPNDITDDDHILVMISPYSGDADLFVRNDRYPENDACESNCKKSTSPGGNIIEIRVGDNWFNNQLYIGVYGETDAMYAITAWVTGVNANRHPIKLGESVTQFSRTLDNRFTYFSFYLDARVNFTISVSPIHGDPDVFVSTETNQPNQGNSQWSKQVFGSDYLPITVDDPNYRTNAFYHIAVFGYTTAVFTISVTKQNDYAALLDGLPADSYVADGAWKYYTYYHQGRQGENVDLRFTLASTTYRGDADLFIYHQSSGRTGLPGGANFQWSSRNSRHPDHVRIHEAPAGRYYIGIEGYKHTDFELIGASEYSHTTLRLGRGVEGSCTANSWIYYRHHSGDEDNSLTFTVVPRTGRVDLFSSQKPNRRPTDVVGRYEFKGVSQGANKYIFIRKPKVNEYYLGVQCFEDSTFIITASAPHVHTRLREGIIAPFNHVPRHYSRWYILDNIDMAKDVTITLNSFYGDSDLYVSQINTEPSHHNYTWSSRRGRGRVDGITIYKDDPNFKTDKLFIGIRGWSESYFQLLAFQTDTEILLNEGVSVPGSVLGPRELGEENYIIYKYVAPEGGGWGQRYTVTFTLSITSGTNTTAVLFVSRSDITRPSSENHHWAAYVFPQRVEVINSRENTFYLSVMGQNANTQGGRIKYVVTARTTQQFLAPNGFAVHEVTRKGRLERFTTSFSKQWFLDEITHALISVTLISGKTRLYVATNNTNPAEMTADYVSTTWPGNTILVPIHDPKFKYDTWGFVVYSEEDSEYFVRAIGRSCQLQSGIPALSKSPVGNATYFWYDIQGEYGKPVLEDHIINIRVRSGSITIYVSQDEVPSPTNYNFTRTFSPTGDSLVVLLKERVKVGMMHIAVYGIPTTGISSTVAEYEILAQPQQAPRYLIHDQTQTHLLATGHDINYFRILNAQQLSKNVYLEVSVCDEIHPPALYLSTQTLHPNLGNYTLTSFQKNQYTTVLKGEVEGASEYFLGVSPGRGTLGQTQYQIYLTTGEDQRPRPVSFQLSEQSYYHGKLTINVPPTVNPQRNQLYYSVYVRQVILRDGIPPNMNMNSVCGIVKHGIHNITFRVLDSTLHQRVLLDVNYRNIYFLNVVAHNDYGLSSAFKPVWVVKGHMYDSFPGEHPMLPISIGGVFLGLLIICFCFYLICGLILNIAKGGRGINVIPNVHFWKDLPYLVLDGFRFVFLCGRKIESYDNLGGEKSGVETTTSEAIEPEGSVNESSGSAYGAI